MTGVNRGPKRQNKISGQFTGHLVEMRESPAWWVLNLAERRLLDRLELEHSHHGGVENGRLIVTYGDFVKARISRKKIKPSLKTVTALGFVEITEQGRGGNADFRRPTRYRLTYQRAHDAYGDGTHEWRRIITTAQAIEIAAKARGDARKKQNPSAPKGLVSVPHVGTEARPSMAP